MIRVIDCFFFDRSVLLSDVLFHSDQSLIKYWLDVIERRPVESNLVVKDIVINGKEGARQLILVNHELGRRDSFWVTLVPISSETIFDILEVAFLKVDPRLDIRNIFIIGGKVEDLEFQEASKPV